MPARMLIGLALFAPTLALAAPRTFQELAAMFVTFINAGIGIALIAGIVIYFYGVATNLHKTASGDVSTLRTHMLWGLIALFVMFSVWGILAVLRNTLFSGGGSYGTGSEYQAGCDTFADCM